MLMCERDSSGTSGSTARQLFYYTPVIRLQPCCFRESMATISFETFLSGRSSFYEELRNRKEELMPDRKGVVAEGRRRFRLTSGVLLTALASTLLLGSDCGGGRSPSESRCPAAPYRCECTDGTFSDSCGIQGACSSHGGVKNPC